MLLLVYLRCGVIVVDADIDGFMLLDDWFCFPGKALLDMLLDILFRDDICCCVDGALCDGFVLLGLHSVPMATRSSGSRPEKFWKARNYYTL